MYDAVFVVGRSSELSATPCGNFVSGVALICIAAAPVGMANSLHAHLGHHRLDGEHDSADGPTEVGGDPASADNSQWPVLGISQRYHGPADAAL